MEALPKLFPGYIDAEAWRDSGWNDEIRQKIPKLKNRLRLEGKVAVVTAAGPSGPGFGKDKAAAILFAQEAAKGV